MARTQSKRARREAARQAARRRQTIWWGSLAAAFVLGVGAIVMFSGGSGSQTAALAPDFELETNTGETVSLSDFAGQPVAVVFMHTF